jgi:hypothetical protein
MRPEATHRHRRLAGPVSPSIATRNVWACFLAGKANLSKHAVRRAWAIDVLRERKQEEIKHAPAMYCFPFRRDGSSTCGKVRD